MPNYVVIFNRLSSADLYAWRPHRFAERLSEATESMLHPPKRLKLKRGDLFAIVPMDYISAIIPNLVQISIFNGSEMKRIPPLPSGSKFFNENILSVFCRGDIEGPDLWHHFGTPSQQLCVRVMLECRDIIEDLPYVSSIVKRIFAQAALWDEEPWQDYFFSDLQREATAKYSASTTDDSLQARINRVSLLASGNLCSVIIGPKNAKSLTETFLGSMSGALAMSEQIRSGRIFRKEALIRIAQRIRPLLSFQEAMLLNYGK